MHPFPPPRPAWALAAGLIALLGPLNGFAREPAGKGLAYRELTGRAEGFAYIRQWRSYYWREDFTLLVRDDGGRLHRVISREPTPWNEYLTVRESDR
jgi:hypothetical protein